MELRDSWEAHHTRPTFQIEGSSKSLQNWFDELLVTVGEKRGAVEAYLFNALRSVPDSAGWHAKAFRLLKLGTDVPDVSVSDLVRFACYRDELRRFNPFLSTQAQADIFVGVLSWLQLCVLEDRLERLITYSKSSSSSGRLMQEIQVHRNWDPREYPHWLALEVEAQFQIRPRQSFVAQHLLQHPGDIIQLNRGEGKTRVARS